MFDLPSVSSQSLFCTTRITSEASDGTSSIGTGFFFRFDVDGHHGIPVIVTNKHVVEGKTFGRFFLHEAVEVDGKTQPAWNSMSIRVENFADGWVFHPDRDVDLCALPIERIFRTIRDDEREIFYRTFGEDIIPDQDTLKQLSALEDVVMVGYPSGLWDAMNNLPLIRKGTTASHPAVDFCGKPRGVVDMACFPGSSGSPVMILNDGSYTMNGAICAGSRLLLLGILFAGPQFAADGSIEVEEIPSHVIPYTRTRIPMHLGYYVKSSELIKLKEEIIRAYTTG